MFWKKDNGETRRAEYQQSFVMGRSGKLRNARSIGVEAEVYRTMGDIFQTMAMGLHQQADALMQQDRDIIDGELFEAMVSGS